MAVPPAEAAGCLSYNSNVRDPGSPWPGTINVTSGKRARTASMAPGHDARSALPDIPDALRLRALDQAAAEQHAAIGNPGDDVVGRVTGAGIDTDSISAIADRDGQEIVEQRLRPPQFLICFAKVGGGRETPGLQSPLERRLDATHAVLRGNESPRRRSARDRRSILDPVEDRLRSERRSSRYRSGAPLPFRRSR